MKSKPYVGVGEGCQRAIFRSATTPTREAFPQFLYAIGPFRTIRGAEFMRDFGRNNPHCRCVAEAERLAARQSTGSRP